MIGIISVNKQGDKIADKIIKYYENLSKDIIFFSKSYDESFSLKDVTRKLWFDREVIIFIGSTGIAVRAIAPLIEHKSKDPAIVVVDVNNLYSISLLSGHLGGANDYAREISEVLKNKAIITTATDNLDIEAPDLIAKKNDLIIDDFNSIKFISSALINKEKVYFKDDNSLLNTPRGYIKTDEFKENLLWVTNKAYVKEFNKKNSLKLIRKNIVLGIGCRKNIDSKKLISFVLSVLKEKNIDERAILKVASIEIKKDEQGIIDLSNRLNAEFVTFSKEEIKLVENNFIGSDFVEKSIGVRAVSEPSAFLLAGSLILEKQAFEGMTISIGELN